MDDDKPFYFIGDDLPCLISGYLKSLREKIDLLFKTVESLGNEQHKVLGYKSTIANEIDFIENHMKDGVRFMYALVDRINSIEKLLPPASRGTKRRRDFFCNPSSSEVKMQRQELLHSKHSAVACGLNPGFIQGPVRQGFGFHGSHVGQYSKEKISLGMNEGETKEVARYLLVSNGSAICLLDLNHNKGSKPISNAYDAPPLPKVATLNLVNKEKLPVSVGLFRLGSDAYMIGGHEFPANFKPNCWCTTPNPSGCEKYKALCISNDLKGTSNATYRLSITNHGTLHPECDDILRLNSPKFWPIVEEVDGRIHVFDSTPSHLVRADRDWIFSHEIFDSMYFSKSGTTSPLLDYFITSHVVVGRSIFAVVANNNLPLVFDSMTNEWELHDPRTECTLAPFFAETVWDVLLRGYVRCVEEIKVGADLYYVLFAIVDSDSDWGGDDPSAIVEATAYLVTSKGGIVCRQKLPNFFEGEVEPSVMNSGTVIKADKEGKTMCAIVIGPAVDTYKDYLFCYTFNAEIITCAVASVVQRTLEAQHLPGALLCLEFMRVHITSKRIYKTDNNDGDFAHFVGMQACFL